MKGTANETVGADFSVEKLEHARNQTLAVILAAAHEIRAGVSEQEAKALISEIQLGLGAPKSWHPPQIRFGENSVLAFGERGIENAVLREQDIYFLDLGPIFDGHEGDVGRSFSVGGNPEFEKCCRDVEEIWHEVQEHWRCEKISGGKLYEFATASAAHRGWKLLLNQANGHRIADFPHAARGRGSIENFPDTPAANRWILEIQIRHPEKPFGAFYEDLLR